MIANLTYGSDFDGLTCYLIENRDHETLSLRGVSSIDHAAKEMQVVADQSQRVQQPAMHVSFSAATEDGVLADRAWLALADKAERELGLVGHQRVIVRHRDKDYDHVHCFWCTVNADTGKTPPKQWFRRKGADRPELDQRALSAEVRATLAPDTVVKGSFNRFALARLMMVCREFEIARGLRQLRGRKAAALAREQGEQDPARGTDHYEERTGRLSIAKHADVIRAALDAPDFPQARQALNHAGFDLEPVMRTRKDGTVDVRGLVVFELVDPANRTKASSFSLPDRPYGHLHIERRHAAGALTIEQWWPSRGETVAASRETLSAVGSANTALVAARDKHRRSEAAKAKERADLAIRHQIERRRWRKRLLRLRRLRAARRAPAQRRAFYASFAATTRAAIWAALERRQARERMPLRRIAMPTSAAGRREAAPVGPTYYSGVTSVQFEDRERPEKAEAARRTPAPEQAVEPSVDTPLVPRRTGQER